MEGDGQVSESVPVLLVLISGEGTVPEGGSWVELLSPLLYAHAMLRTE